MRKSPAPAGLFFAGFISSHRGGTFARMLILERLISRSSRSLAAMIGFGRAGASRGRGRRAGGTDDDRISSTFVFPPAFLPPRQHTNPAAHATDSLRRCPIVLAARRTT
jgi:hypothetical protein